jgi:Amt family ammonium transporter
MWNINGWAFKLGVLDFAGGNVVHISSGFAGLACAMQYPKSKHSTMGEHKSTSLTLLGCCLLWFGWFGFNGGSALAANSLATIACINTNMSAASAGLTWISLEYFIKG